jgi:hypothetical protein
MKLLVMQFSPTTHHFIPLQSKYFSQLPVHTREKLQAKL